MTSEPRSAPGSRWNARWESRWRSRWQSRELRLAGLLTALVVLLRLALARPVHFCGTPDACFYLQTAQTLAEGHSFHARVVYDFQLPNPTLPNTGLEYWRPGISLLLLLLRPVGGVTLHGAIVLTTLVGVLFAAAAWHLARQAGFDRRLALCAFALCLLGPSPWDGSLSPDSGLFYGTAVAWFLALFTVRRQGLAQDGLALVCVAFAYLIRNDAALLLLPLAAVLYRRWQTGRQAAEPAPGSSPAYAAAMLAGFVLALAPMHGIYRAVLGTAFPHGTARVLFLNDLSDFERFHDPVSLPSLLAHGWRHLAMFRLATLATVIYRIAALTIGYPALLFLPALLPGAHRRGSTQAPQAPAPQPLAPQPPALQPPAPPLPEFTGAAVFLLAALAVYGLVLPAIGGFSALRTAEGVVPLVAVLSILGIRRVAATPRLGAVLTASVLAVYALAGVMDDRRDVLALNATGDRLTAEAAGLRELGGLPQSSVVMTGDPVQFSETTGFAAVALPNNGPQAVLAAARQFHVGYVLLDTDAPPAAPGDTLQGLGPVRLLPLPAQHTLILALRRPG